MKQSIPTGDTYSSRYEQFCLLSIMAWRHNVWESCVCNVGVNLAIAERLLVRWSARRSWVCKTCSGEVNNHGS